MKNIVFPKDATLKFVDPVSGRAGCVMPAIKQTISIENQTEDFFNKHCTNCPIYRTATEIRDGLTTQGQIPTAPKITKYASANGFCLARPEQMYDCPKGNVFTDTTTFEIEVQPTLWVYDSKPKGKHKYFVYDITEQNGVMFIKPFRLSNMYESGAICFSKLGSAPLSLREAYSVYWSSPKNNEHCPEKNYMHHLQNYEEYRDSGEWIKFEADGYTTYAPFDAVSYDLNEEDGSLNKMFWVRELENRRTVYFDEHHNVYLKNGGVSSTAKLDLLAHSSVFTI